MPIQNQVDFGKDRSKQFTPGNRFQHATKETLFSNAHTDLEEDISTIYDSKGIYLIPTDGSMNHEYMSVNYNEGILLSFCISFKV